MPIRRKTIKRLVEDILTTAKISEPPIPVERTAKDLRLLVRYEPFQGELSGCLIRQGDGATVGINSLHHENRQRFTLAHEIGHYLLHKGEEVIVDRGFRVNRRDAEAGKAENPEEIEANYFAAELLMPERLLLNDLKGREFDIDIENDELIRELAKRYRVSTQALTHRLVNLGFIISQ